MGFFRDKLPKKFKFKGIHITLKGYSLFAELIIGSALEKSAVI